METRRKIKKKKIKPVRLIFKIIGYMFAVLILAFVAFQIYRAIDSKITTEPAIEYKMYDTINVDGYVIRDETVVNNKRDGVLTFEIGEAESVKKDGVIAYLYPDTQSLKVKQDIEKLDSEIEQLEMVELSNGTNPGMIDKQVDEKLSKYLQIIESGNVQGLDEIGLQMLLLFNKRQVLTNEDSMTTIVSRINKLKKEKSDLEKQLKASPDAVRAPSAGYFTTHVDGCEGLVDFENVTKMTIDEFSLLPEKIEKVNDKDTIGKVVEQYTWYYVFEIPQESLSRMKKGMSVNAVFDNNTKQTVPMTLVAINSPSGKNNVKGTVGVFRCSVMNEELISLRRVSAQIQIKEYSGLRVNTKAVRFNESNQMGVYVLEGNMISFKLINPAYTSDTFIICGDPPKKQDAADEIPEDNKDDQTEENTAGQYAYLSRYDEIIIEGKDLSHGKVISNY